MSLIDSSDYGIVLEAHRLCKSFARYESEWHRVSSWFSHGKIEQATTLDVLKDISFRLYKGEAIGLVGANGAGKSTLLKILSGTTIPTSGSYSIRGRVSSILELGMGFSLELDAQTNVRHALGLMGFSAEQISQSMDEIRDFAEVGAAWSEPLRTYSSGMQMRVAFAVATASRPDVLIVDEALSVGDTYFQHKCMDRIRAFRKAGSSLLLVSHDPSSIIGLCSRVLLLDRGSILMDGEAAVVMDFYNALIAEHESRSEGRGPAFDAARQHRRSDGLVQTESGTGAARFDSLSLVDHTGLPIEYVQSGEAVSLLADVEVLSPLPRLVFGFMIKDRLGMAVFGTNSFHQEKILFDLKAGQVLNFRSDFLANLGPGSYSISVALTSSDTHLIDNFQWRDVALVFRVYNDAEPYFLGLARLDAPISVSSGSAMPIQIGGINGVGSDLPQSQELKRLVQSYLKAERDGNPWHEEQLRVAIYHRWAREDLRLGEQDDRIKEKRCPLCAQTSLQHRWTKRVSYCQFGGGRLTRWQCPNCDLIFGDQKMLALSASDLSWEYRLHYRCYQEADNTDIELRTFYTLNPKPGKRYLNWGAGAWSKTITILRGLGFEVWGYDPYVSGASDRDQYHYINDISELSLQRFDGVFSNNVIEHATDPVAFLVATARLLQPGGRLAHASPCWEYSFEYTRFHLFFFPGRCRDFLFRQAGLALHQWHVDWEAKGAAFLCPLLSPVGDRSSVSPGLEAPPVHAAAQIGYDKLQAGVATDASFSLGTYPFVSYAQNSEDVLIWRALGDIPNGVYVDVGAGHPVRDSITKALYDRGWRGLNIDADPRSIARLRQQRPRDRSVHSLVGDSAEALIWLSDDPLSSSSTQDFAGHGSMPMGIGSRALSSVIDEFRTFIGDDIHLLKIDVEGDEIAVLRGMDFGRSRPWLMVVESTQPHSEVAVHSDWEGLLKNAYYEPIWFDGLNRYYLAAERLARRSKLSSQPHIFDKYIAYHQALSAAHFAAANREDDALNGRRAAIRPTLAYCAPVPPEASGIAYYALRVLEALSLRYDITIVTNNVEATDPSMLARHRLIDYEQLQRRLPEFDRVICHLGNSPFHAQMLSVLGQCRAAVICHDVFLGDLLSYVVHNTAAHQALPDWLNPGETPSPMSASPMSASPMNASPMSALLFDAHGLAALSVEKVQGLARALWQFPLLAQIFRQAGSVIVHSGHAQAEIERFFPGAFLDRARLIQTVLPRAPELGFNGFPRGLSAMKPRLLDREALGIAAEDFLVVSLGYLRPGKCCEALLSGFAAFARQCAQRSASAASKAPNLPQRGWLRLVFVGAYAHPDDPWVIAFNQAIKQVLQHLERVCVQVTGWVADDRYQQWIGAADVAVQLRTESRGESSGSALDAMAFGLPLIVNRHGALAELGAAIVIETHDELAQVLERLHRDLAYRLHVSSQSWKWVSERHSPLQVAAAYTGAIEAAARSSDPVGALSVAPQTTLWIDVSVLANVDSGTGIQRVVRAIASKLIEPITRAGLRVELVRLEHMRIRRALRLSERWFALPHGSLGEETIVLPQAGDSYLLLDLHTDEVSRSEPLLAALAARGVRLHAVVYDLLPISHPEWFPNDAALSFVRWAQVVAKHCSGLHAISRSTAFDIARYLVPRGSVRWFHLGADIEASLPFADSDEGLSALRAALGATESPAGTRPMVLMVSTVEPRKGHAQVLDAFEQLWCAGSDAGKGLAHDVMPTDRLQHLRDWRDARLVIVGHPGWCVDQLKQRLESHPERGQRLFWLQHLSDAALLDLYASADLFLMASEGEGFGLPIVEAARHGLPLLLRDLPVFREIADGHAMWFADDCALAEALVSAFIALRDGTAPCASAMPMLSWQQSAEALAVQLLGSMTAATAHPEQPLDARA